MKLSAARLATGIALVGQLVIFFACATPSHADDVHVGRSTALSPYITVQNASAADIETAKAMVSHAIAEMTKLNKARLEHPVRNRFQLKPGTKIGHRKRARDAPPPPLLPITHDLARAAALVAELDAQQKSFNESTHLMEKRGGSFWMGNLDHKGSVPWGNDSSYKVFRNVVTDYNADPGGGRDSTKEIQKAIADGKRCGANCNGSTTKNAIVYFPPGKYLVSSSIAVYFGTQMIGDALDPPTIIAAPSFVGLGVFSTDVYVEEGGIGPDGNSLEWYVNTARFYSQIRNFKMDITATAANASVAALHYQVAQATSLEHVEFIADSSTTQQAIFAENGSGGVMSDLTFTGGKYGISTIAITANKYDTDGGSQQFSAARLTFDGCNTAVQTIWDWGWVWKSITVKNAQVGFRLYNDASNEIPGSATFVDSVFDNIKEASIEMATPQDKLDSGFTGLVLDNVKLGAPIKDNSNSQQILASGYYKYYLSGSTYVNNTRSFTNGPLSYTREASLLGSAMPGLDAAPYYERAREQYTQKSAADFVHLKDEGAKGDGATDDTKAVQNAFNKYKDGSRIIYVDAGTYILKDTVTIPSGVKMVGETWSQFAASGDAFSDASKPKPMLKVGNEGDVGSVEMQDLILTSKGPTPGVILMEWNIQASSNGDAALWDVHVRLGGAAGTELTPNECPPLVTGTNPDTCKVASLLLHITPKASGYFDNFWAWVADHQIDDPDLNDPENNMTQLSVYSARGVLVESQKATFLYGTASEHSVFYQYNFHQAKNIVTTFLQTESAYYQPTPKPPAPFANYTGVFPGDPGYKCEGADDFSGCDASWAVLLTESSNILISSAGVYSWFSTYTQDCIDQHSCQKSLIFLDSNYDDTRLQQVVSIGAQNIIVTGDKNKITSKDNQAVSTHPQWAHISLYDVPSKGKPPLPPEEKCDRKDYFRYEGDWPDYNITGLVGLSRPGAPLGNSSHASTYMPAYATIVNLTPHNFKHVGGPKPYQFYKWDFADIPSGRGRRNDCWYDQAGVDLTTTNGYAYYEIEGTDKKFRVWVSTNMDDVKYQQRIWFDLTGMGMGAKEYTVPGLQRPVTLVIGGSKEYGFFSSLQFGNYNWMRDMYDVIKDRKLHEVIVPGSHDAAMNTITLEGWWGSGTADNTETQSLDLYNQLRVGSRYFDMRIVSVNNGIFYGAHVSDELASIPNGATGPRLDDLIAGMNRFSQDYPGEVVVWWIRYMTDLGAKGGTYWSEDKIQEFYDKLEKIENRCDESLNLNLTRDIPLDALPISTFMDAKKGKGCFLLLIDGNLDPKFDKTKLARPDKGIYYGPPTMNRSDIWAQQAYAGKNGISEINSLLKQVNRANQTMNNADNYYIMQWQCTPAGDPIQDVAVLESNPTLYYYGLNYMTPTKFPTVILHDAVGVFRTDQITEKYYDPTMQVFVRALNLYMVSQNCDVSPSKNPLVKPPKVSAKVVAKGKQPSSEPFNGLVFSNGTVLDIVPPSFRFL